MGALVNLSGRRFERLIVVGRDPTPAANGAKAKWRCLCDCGNETVAIGVHLRGGQTRSCGCIRRETTTAKNKTHGQSDTPEYQTWASMIGRCTNPNRQDYERYGARGTQVCDRWLNSFEAFFEDMGQRPSPKHSIDRFPNNAGNYEPGNCRWATASEQAFNRRPKRPKTP